MQEEVDEVCDALTRGYLNLRLKPNTANYSAKTWTVVENEVIKAQAVLYNSEVSEAEVKAAEKALTKDLEGLVAKPGDITTSIKTGENGLMTVFAGLSILSLLRRKED